MLRENLPNSEVKKKSKITANKRATSTMDVENFEYAFAHNKNPVVCLCVEWVFVKK